MIKFNGEEVQAAWEDYKGFLEGLGTQQHAMKMIEVHFKQGYALGVAFAEGKQVKPIERKKRYPRPNGRGQKRYRSDDERITCNVRTEEVRNKQELHLLSYLQQRVVAIELAEIISHMIKVGFTDWNNRNASSYMVTLMKGYPSKVSKVSRGLYQYTGGQVL